MKAMTRTVAIGAVAALLGGVAAWGVTQSTAPTTTLRPVAPVSPVLQPTEIDKLKEQIAALVADDRQKTAELGQLKYALSQTTNEVGQLKTKVATLEAQAPDNMSKSGHGHCSSYGEETVTNLLHDNNALVHVWRGCSAGP
ncbi:MAG: hypothetical protein KGJ78_10025 [Alphaproteobacteria bacterium]|nr:hypothetical protein [Alphaproteobacteria bacterium]